jgi:hypothetical protein
VHNIEIERHGGHALESGRHHPDHDDFNALVSESDENFVILGLFGWHGES